MAASKVNEFSKWVKSRLDHKCILTLYGLKQKSDSQCYVEVITRISVKDALAKMSDKSYYNGDASIDFINDEDIGIKFFVNYGKPFEQIKK
jgi:hypothetical protein